MFCRLNGWDRLILNWLNIYKYGYIVIIIYIFFLLTVNLNMFLRNCTLFVHMEEIQKREISRKLSNIETSPWEAVESSPLLNGRNNLNENWMEACLLKQCCFLCYINFLSNFSEATGICWALFNLCSNYPWL